MINTFLLPEDKLMPEIHVRQTGFTCSALLTTKKECKN